MKRTNWYWLILNSILLVVFNVFFFVLTRGENHNNSIWICYGFLHFAYFILLATPLFVRKGAFSADYSRPLFLISSLYFLLVLIIGSIFIGIPNTSTTSWLTHIALFCIFATCFFSNLIANEHTANALEKREQELQYVKITSSQLKTIMNQLTDSKTTKQVEQLYDYVHSSQIKSSPNVFEIEQNIMIEIGHLFNAIHLDDNISIVQISNKMLQMAMERNRKLGLLN